MKRYSEALKKFDEVIILSKKMKCDSEFVREQEGGRNCARKRLFEDFFHQQELNHFYKLLLRFDF